MAVSKGEVQVTWSASNSTTLQDTGTTSATSDAAGLSATAFMGDVMCKVALNSGTAADGDLITFYALYGGIDPDGASTAEWDSSGAGTKLCTLDPFAEATPIKTVPIRTPDDVKIYAEYSAAGTAHYDVSCAIHEYKA